MERLGSAYIGWEGGVELQRDVSLLSILSFLTPKSHRLIWSLPICFRGLCDVGVQKASSHVAVTEIVSGQIISVEGCPMHPEFPRQI